MTLVSGDMTSGEMTFGRLDRKAPQRVGFLHRFSLKTVIDFASFGLQTGMVFKGTTGVYERIYCFNSKLARQKEK